MWRAWRLIRPWRRKPGNLQAGQSRFIFVFMDRPGDIILPILMISYRGWRKIYGNF